MGNCLRSSAAAASPSLTSSPTTASHVNKNMNIHSDSGISNTSRSNNTTRSSKTSSSSASASASSKNQFSSGSSGSAVGDDTYPDGRILATPNLRSFTFQELKVATRNFKPDTLLGEGGFGKVYKGWLDHHHHHKQPSSSSSSSHSHRTATQTLVAIKKLNSESLQGFQEWQTEIDFLGRLSHPNLVKLLGYCWEDSELLLVYEFLQRGSLENHLFGRGSAVQPLPWEHRIKIAIGVARGFAFLHASDDRVIFRDMKAANILLDGVYNAKISDFGLAKLGPSSSQSHVTTRIMGTYGYAAPEYVATGHLYIKSDVYGFGVVLVELLTGLRALDTTRPTGQHTLVDWIKPYLSDKRKLKGIMDSRLEGKYPSKAAFEMALLALNCLAQEPRARPSMHEAFQILDSLQQRTPTRPRDRPKRPPPPPTPQIAQLPLLSHHPFPRSPRLR